VKDKFGKPRAKTQLASNTQHENQSFTDRDVSDSASNCVSTNSA
jgi:hypothetical protein